MARPWAVIWLRTIALGSVLALGGCASTPPPAQPVIRSGPVGNVTNAPAGAGVNVAAGSAEDFIVNVGRRVFFKERSDELNDTAKETLNIQAGWLNTFTQYPVKVDGFADDPGSAADNMKLGLRRAETVRSYLISQGVDPGRIRARSSGNTRPTVRCADISCKAQNRHVRTVLDPATPGGQQPADIPLAGTSEPETSARAASGTTYTTASGATLAIRGRVIGEGIVRR